jgi:hypothetical protein
VREIWVKAKARWSWKSIHKAHDFKLMYKVLDTCGVSLISPPRKTAAKNLNAQVCETQA